MLIKPAIFTRSAPTFTMALCAMISSRVNPLFRKNSITNEIRGEKIDIIKYSESPEEFIRAALAPATVASVTETGERSCSVLVEDDQLSLAIGKEGQNARLAARLTGFNKIDIKSVSAARTEAFNNIIEGKAKASGSFGENLAQALKSAMESDEE